MTPPFSWHLNNKTVGAKLVVKHTPHSGGRHCMIVGFTTTYATSAYYH
jgi:hypothetical protein